MRRVSCPIQGGGKNPDEDAYADYNLACLGLPVAALPCALLSCLGVHRYESLEPIVDLAYKSTQ